MLWNNVVEMSDGDIHDDPDKEGRHETRFDEFEEKYLSAAWCGELELDEDGEESCREEKGRDSE
jgi:hypothetical protein